MSWKQRITAAKHVHKARLCAQGKAVCTTVHEIDIHLFGGNRKCHGSKQDKETNPTAIHLGNYDTDMLHNIRF